jgi:manganese/zinc/iron transport system permease protein
MWAALTLQAGWNATLVTLAATCLGVAAGAVGAFLYLRRRVLVSDAMAHATLPGIGLAFLLMALAGLDGRWLPGLMAGAAVTAALGLWLQGWLARRLPDDAAIAGVLAGFYGAGIVVLTVVQSAGLGRPAGLETVLLGQASAMLAADAWTVAILAVAVVAAVMALNRSLAMVAFDPVQARMMGLSPRGLDALLMTLVLGVVLVGLHVVGLILIVAMLVIPAATARLWSASAAAMAGLSALAGGVAGYLGAAVSASAPDLPTGPVIVLVAAAGFALSLLAAPRGLILRAR